jgi:hypothetical protein
MRVRLLISFMLAVAASVGVAGHAGADEPPPVGDPQHAWFEGETIDLSESWDKATACIELGDHTECFRTEAELLAAHPELVEARATPQSPKTRAAGGVTAMASNCSSFLTVYRDNNFGGGGVSFNTRGVWINLSGWGIDNQTSSYKIGACSATFRAGASGSGATYPGVTAPGVQIGAMTAGWDNVVSSLLIN